MSGSGRSAPTLSVVRAIAAIGDGRPALVAGRADGGFAAALLIAADAATPERVAFLVRHSLGTVGVALRGGRLAELGLARAEGSMRRASSLRTPVTSVDARGAGAAAGSADDRTRTIAWLADPCSRPVHFTQPGHVLVWEAGGTDAPRHRSRVDAALDLARLAGRAPAAAMAELATPDKRGVAEFADASRFAREHGLPLVSVDELAVFRAYRGGAVRALADASLPTRSGEFECGVWEAEADGCEHLYLIKGLERDAPTPLVAIERECMGGHVLRGTACDCRARLERALEAAGESSAAVLLYLRDRGDAGPRLSHAPLEDGPDLWSPAAQFLRERGVDEVRLAGGSAGRRQALAEYGVEVVG